MKNRFFRILAAAAGAVAAVSVTGVTAFAEEAGASNQQQAGPQNSLFTLVISLVFMLGILYFMAIRPQKKQEQQLKEMQESIEVGDEIVTSGGIIGIVVRKADDNIVIETGGERNKIRIKSWAIAENISAKERKEEASGKKAASEPSVASAGLVDDDEEDKKPKKKKKNSDEE